MPFPEMRCRISVHFEHFRQRDLSLEQMRFLEGFENHIAVDAGACMMGAPVNNTARGRPADGGPSVEIGENALPRQRDGRVSAFFTGPPVTADVPSSPDSSASSRMTLGTLP